MLAPWKESHDQPREHIILLTKVRLVKAVADTMESEVCLTKTVFRERTLGITFCQYFITEHQELGLMRWSPEGFIFLRTLPQRVYRGLLWQSRA